MRSARAAMIVMAAPVGLAATAQAQQADTTAPGVYALPAITVSATRSGLPLGKVPLSVQTVDRRELGHARPGWGLDEALAFVPGVFVANRFNFSLDQRIAVRGFGSRSAFAVRGVKILIDGIPQTLPDGQGQLTNLELGDIEHIEVLRGSTSSLFGNASGGVISLWTDPAPPRGLREEARIVAGWFDRPGRAWHQWRSTTALPLGRRGGSAQVSASRLSYDGERDHSAADLRNLNTRVRLPLGPTWSLTAIADAGDDPRADNPGALTLDELHTNRAAAPAINLSSHAGKDVTQLQGGVTLRHALAAGGEAAVTLFGVTRRLANPTTFAYIDLRRRAYGARLTATRPVGSGTFASQLTAGLDFQRQRDDRVNTGNAAGRPDGVRSLDQLEHVTEIGPFLQGAVPLAARVTLTTGARYDWVRFQVADRLVSDSNPDDSGDRLMRALSASAGIAADPSRAVTLYANAGSSFETPTTTELTNRPDSAGGFNPALRPQRAWTYEVGARGRVGDRGAWSAALFQVDVRDELISYEVPTSPERRFFRNAGSARHRGLEVGGSARLPAGVRFNGSYTYSDFRYVHYAFSRDDSSPAHVLDGHALPGIPRHALHLGLRVVPDRAHGAWVEVETTGMSSVLVDDTLATRAGGWWATDVRLGWDGRVGGQTFEPFVAVNNVFNRMYVGSVVINAARGRYYEPAPGRNVYVGLSLGAGR